MKKKEKLKNMLTILGKDSLLFIGIRLLIERDSIQDDDIDKIVDILKQAVSQTKDQSIMKSFEKVIDTLENIKGKEDKEREKEINELKEMEVLMEV